ncbi:MAG: transcription antitermination factor NusB [Candidatus Poribacteria bacterium]|nr:transcription antitermination factor NusB [Candidatus Poribacteria bacterium]MDE0325374.1 transcription antitermination factor NusB [Candidatus Poribacteria bacterium]
MSSRRQSRIVAMQMLYQIQLTDAPVSIVMERFWQSQDTSVDLRPFVAQLVEGTTAHLETIDTVLQNTSKNWKLHRMPVVDLSILRCATYEILYVSDIDAATSINEAIEIAKSYSTPDSPKFINGVLDGIRKKQPDVPED